MSLNTCKLEVFRFIWKEYVYPIRMKTKHRFLMNLQKKLNVYFRCAVLSTRKSPLLFCFHTKYICCMCTKTNIWNSLKLFSSVIWESYGYRTVRIKNMINVHTHTMRLKYRLVDALIDNSLNGFFHASFL